MQSPIKPNRAKKPHSFRRLNRRKLKYPAWAKIRCLVRRIFWPKPGIFIRHRTWHLCITASSHRLSSPSTPSLFTLSDCTEDHLLYYFPAAHPFTRIHCTIVFKLSIPAFFWNLQLHPLLLLFLSDFRHFSPIYLS